jgi:SAM-dependent methyltransferase
MRSTGPVETARAQPLLPHFALPCQSNRSQLGAWGRRITRARTAVSLRVVIPNRVKFFFAGSILEAINPLIPGRPHQRVAALVGHEPGTVLDVCAGTGYLARLIARGDTRTIIYALDASPEMLAVGRRKAVREGLGARVSFVRGDAAELPFGDGTLGTVVAAFGFHELPRPVRERAIAEIARTLRPNGRLLTVDLDRPERRSRVFVSYLRIFEAPHARDVLGDGLVDSLGRAGLETIERVTSQGSALLPFQIVQARRRE